ncbi:MAG: patatin-like phospholipase family protein, partial [Fibrobacterota bacterium]
MALFIPMAIGARQTAVLQVSSGGVSLGSYQAGYLKGRLETTQEEDTGKFVILTGASAGSINSIASLYHVFHTTRDYEPFEEWIKIGW